MADNTDFEAALILMFSEAESAGHSCLDVRAPVLCHRVTGTAPSGSQLSRCCREMVRLMEDGDQFLYLPLKGDGEKLVIRYELPRPKKAVRSPPKGSKSHKNSPLNWLHNLPPSDVDRLLTDLETYRVESRALEIAVQTLREETTLCDLMLESLSALEACKRNHPGFVFAQSLYSVLPDVVRSGMLSPVPEDAIPDARLLTHSFENNVGLLEVEKKRADLASRRAAISSSIAQLERKRTDIERKLDYVSNLSQIITAYAELVENDLPAKNRPLTGKKLKKSA